MPQRPSQQRVKKPGGVLYVSPPGQAEPKEPGLEAGGAEGTLRQTYGKGDEEKGPPSLEASSVGESPSPAAPLAVHISWHLKLSWPIALSI